MMKLQCDKCGYMLGGIEVKENYGCNFCNPFFNTRRGVKVGDGDYEIMKQFIGNTHSAVNSVPVVDANPMPKAPSRPPLPIKYCGICARILTQTPIGTYYDHDTAEPYNHWRFTCPEYRWWKFWDRYHANWKCNEDGSTYAYEA